MATQRNSKQDTPTPKMMTRVETLAKCKRNIAALLDCRDGRVIEETSYPSNCLRWVRKGPIQRLPNVQKHRNREEKKAESPSGSGIPGSVKLKIVIVGAGIGGLTTAIALKMRGFDDVVVLERKEDGSEIGAGIQIPPNASLLLTRLGLGPYLSTHAHTPTAVRLRRWENGELIGLTRLNNCASEFGAKFLVIHRVGLINSLLHRARELGVQISFGKKVGSFKEGVATDSDVCREGSSGGVIWEVRADLVVGADGLHSEARKSVLGDQVRQDFILPTGFAAYRAVVDTEKMRKDPELEWLCRSDGQNLWIGHNRHIMTYLINNGKSFNMVLSHPSTTDPSTWSQETDIQEVRRQFSGWDPCIQKLLTLITHTLKWPLLTGTPLPTWLSHDFKTIILGDAAHPMLPYMSAGAAMAVEDGCALAEVLSRLTSATQLPSALKVWEEERLLRTAQMQEASLVNGRLWHFADGPAQRARDEAMRGDVSVDGGNGVSPNQWSDGATRQWVYGYDAEWEVREAWEKQGGDGGSWWYGALS
ncbi:FAD/NAD(P)-binding domain-containing protein [Sporormia fimetaria CBS 119925]|uniref:FAD/NAD(P)-binding domain-containing protein n=1 Tax=Sporormia fimetaria CBS 119925 TaxID=1340428 RepID=A0A6A6VPU6_9PLEO|nr:FAD/NAD(P)-binding domain-containing protein [Sporormia fimetaria CBS 119925]